jgi:hypothetical protein
MVPLMLLKAVPLWVYPAVALLAWGGCSNYKAGQAKAKLAAAAQQSEKARAVENEKARATERSLVEGAGRVADELSKAQANVSAARRGVEQRLRAAAEAGAAGRSGAAAPAACGGDDTPAIGVLSRQAREDLVSFAEDAEQVRQRLMACQALARDIREKLK